MLLILLFFYFSSSRSFSVTSFKKFFTPSKNQSSEKTFYIASATAFALLFIVFLLKFLKYIKRKNQDHLDKGLIRACESGNLKKVKELHQKGANLRYKEWTFNRYGLVEKSSINMASKGGYTEIIKYLVRNGVNIDQERIVDTRRSEERYTPLVDAVKSGKLGIVRYLVENGADINTKTIRGSFEQERCCFAKAYSKRNFYLLRYLLENGAKIPSTNIEFGGVDGNGTFRVVSMYDEIERHRLLKGYKKISDYFEELEDGYIETDLFKVFISCKKAPAYTKQKAIIKLMVRLQDNFDLMEMSELRDLIKLIPFNNTFLKKLYDNMLLKFVLDNQLQDRSGRDIFEACSIYSNRSSWGKNFKSRLASEFILPNYFSGWADVYKSSIDDLKRYLDCDNRSVLQKIISPVKKLFCRQKNKAKDQAEESKLEKILKKHKARNLRFYQKVLNKVFVFHIINQTKLPGEVSAIVSGFVDCGTEKGLVEDLT